jgi:serine/threonine protein kinase
MQQLNHPSLLSAVDLLQDEYRYYVILELCPNGDLWSLLSIRKSLTESESKQIFKEVLEGLNYLHSRGIAHRDIKPENILLDSTNHAKLADFGFSKIIPPGTVTSTICGSPYFSSPELLSSQSYDARKSDMWACGVLLYALVVGTVPWTNHQVNQLMDQIRAAQYAIPSFVGSECKNLIRRMLCLDLDERISAAEALSHPWLSDVKTQPVAAPNCQTRLSLETIDRVFAPVQEYVRAAVIPRKSSRSVLGWNVKINSRKGAPTMPRRPLHLDFLIARKFG